MKKRRLAPCCGQERARAAVAQAPLRIKRAQTGAGQATTAVKLAQGPAALAIPPPRRRPLEVTSSVSSFDSCPGHVSHALSSLVSGTAATPNGPLKLMLVVAKEDGRCYYSAAASPTSTCSVVARAPLTWSLNGAPLPCVAWPHCARRRPVWALRRPSSQRSTSPPARRSERLHGSDING